MLQRLFTRIFPGAVAFWILLAVVAIDTVWILAGDIRITLEPLARVFLQIFVLLTFWIALHLCRAVWGFAIFARLIVFVEGLAFLLAAWAAIRIYNHLGMTIPVAYTDPLLAGMDNALAFDWHSYFAAVANNTFLRELLDWSYVSMTQVSFGAFCILVFFTTADRTRYFVTSFLITAVICATIGALFPAEAAVAYYQPAKEVLANFVKTPGVYHLTHMEALRSDPAHILNLNVMPGLVTFPSFHTAGAIVITAAFRRTRLFWPAFAYSALMIAATPVFGGHYFIDLIGGAVIAFAVIAVMDRNWSYKLAPAKVRYRPATA